jgi:hypothetical protein
LVLGPSLVFGLPLVPGPSPPAMSRAVDVQRAAQPSRHSRNAFVECYQAGRFRRGEVVPTRCRIISGLQFPVRRVGISQELIELRVDTSHESLADVEHHRVGRIVHLAGKFRIGSELRPFDQFSNALALVPGRLPNPQVFEPIDTSHRMRIRTVHARGTQRSFTPTRHRGPRTTMDHGRPWTEDDHGPRTTMDRGRPWTTDRPRTKHEGPRTDPRTRGAFSRQP